MQCDKGCNNRQNKHKCFEEKMTKMIVYLTETVTHCCSDFLSYGFQTDDDKVIQQ